MLDVPGVADQEVHVGIRPEGFELDPNGALCCKLQNVEVMGRDSSVVVSHATATSPVVRAIIDSDELKFAAGTTVSFDLKPGKVFAFRKQTGERIAL